MGRIRTVKPELYQHHRLFLAEAESGLPIRFAFTGLLTQCDREGRFRWEPELLKLNILPYDDVDFSRVLDVLSTRHFVVKYRSSSENDPRWYGMIPSFSKHQHINNRELKSVLPEPPPEAFSERVNDASSTGGDASGTPLCTARGEGKGREGKTRQQDASSSLPSNEEIPTAHPPPSTGFEEFWMAYPKTNGSRKTAFDRWKKIVGSELKKDPDFHKVVLAGLEAHKSYKAEMDRQRRFAAEFPFAEKWLKERRWENAPTLPEGETTGPGGLVV